MPPGASRTALRELARLVMESMLAGAFVSVVLALAVFIVATQAEAALPAADVEQGTLLLRGGDGARSAAPLLATDVHIDVTGMTARARVTQRFVNPTAEWREGVYLFPLPEHAAVDHLDMRVGGRVIEGQIKERQAARAAYEAAKQEGRKASLIEQERPNLFTTSVAHIGPDEEIVVSIEYQEKLAYDNGTFRLRFPTAVTPRYVPGTPLSSGAPPGSVGTAAPTDAVPDADRITPRVADPADGAVNPLTLTIDLDAGFPLARVASAYHPVRIVAGPGHRYRVMLATGSVPAARDFELAYVPDVGAAPAAALFTENVDGRRHALVMVLPPTTRDMAGERAPREVTYIVDTSGSMEGVSIAQAREAMLVALERLRPGDRFNVIEFNSTTRALFTAPVPLDPATLDAARAFVRGLRARGGTEMKPALEAAFAPARRDDLIRQVVFMTDGAVGNEGDLLELIGRQLGDRRLFTIGIGPAPNTYFMRKAAEAGRGTFTFIGDVREVKERMTALIRKLESPVLTDVRIDWPTAVESYPRQMPDLYAGEPVVLTAVFPLGAVVGAVQMAGRSGAQSWRASLPHDGGASQPGVGVLFARDKIEAIEDARRNVGSVDDAKRATIAVALAHHLVSAYTSLVAVDVTPTAPAGILPLRTGVPGNLPDGLSHEAITGLPQTATPALLELLAGALLLVTAWLGRRLLLDSRAAAQPRGGAGRFHGADPGALRRLAPPPQRAVDRDRLARLHSAEQAARRTC